VLPAHLPRYPGSHLPAPRQRAHDGNTSFEHFVALPRNREGEYLPSDDISDSFSLYNAVGRVESDMSELVDDVGIIRKKGS
jgi:hypothetical protein